jgi:hypothetical protein
MNRVYPDAATAAASELHRLHGRSVLIKSSRDHGNPPAGVRGWIEVHENPGASPDVRIAVEFPQMFSVPAHHRTIPLDPQRLERLLATEYNGVFEFTLDDDLI